MSTKEEGGGEHNFGAIHISHTVVAGKCSTNHQRVCMTCGIIQKYGREFGSRKHPGFASVDQKCPPISTFLMINEKPSPTSLTTEYYYYDDLKQREKDNVKQRAVKYLAQRSAEQRQARHQEINRRRLENTEFQEKEEGENEKEEEESSTDIPVEITQ